MATGEECDDGGSGCAPLTTYCVKEGPSHAPPRERLCGGRATWLAWAVALAAVAACWGVSSVTRRQVEDLRSELRALEVKNTQQGSLAASGCVTGAKGGAAEGGWQLVRADGSEAGYLELPPGVPEGANRHQSVDASLRPPHAPQAPPLPQVPIQMVTQQGLPATATPGATAQQLQASGSWAPPVRVPAAPAAVAAAPSSASVAASAAATAAAAAADAERGAGAALGALSGTSDSDEPRLARLRPGLLGSSSGDSGAGPGAGRPEGQQLSAKSGSNDDDFAELMCGTAPRGEWAQVKAEAARQLGAWSAGASLRQGPELLDLLSSAVEKLQAVHGLVNECGLGRLCMSLLAVLTGDVDGSLHSAPALHAPLLSVLLDVPWALAFSSGWPIFALLAQLQLQSHGSDDLPASASGHQAEYYAALHAGLVVEDPAALARAGAAFLERRGGEAEQHAMPVLCALASQLLGDDIRPGAEAAEALKHVQNFFRQSVQSVDDLHASIVSAWPLYGVLHAAAARLAGLRAVGL